MGQLEKLLIGLSDPLGIVSVIKDFAFSEAFVTYAESTAMKMVTQLFTDAGRTWRKAASKNSQGRLIYKALTKELEGPMGNAVRRQIALNAEIIKTMPLDIANRVNEHVLKETFKGTRSNNIAEQLQSLYPEITANKAKLIARTETSKTATALAEARCQNLGVNWYVWRTSEDSRVRDAHALMEGVLIRWNDPPSPESLDGDKRTYGHYHAGNIFNCRCYPAPVIDLDLIKWPSKVYYNGGIHRMTRKQFEQIA